MRSYKKVTLSHMTFSRYDLLKPTPVKALSNSHMETRLRIYRGVVYIAQTAFDMTFSESLASQGYTGVTWVIKSYDSM